MGGMAFEGTSSIESSRLDDTVGGLSESTGISFNELRDGFLGSTGKKSVSGDIDIGLDQGRHRVGELLDLLRDAYGRENVRSLPHGVTAVKLPIAGSSKFVQTDLMIGVPDWLKFSFHAPGEGESEYKGLFRSQLLRAVAKSLRQQDFDDAGDLLAEIGPSLDYLEGLKTTQKGRRPKIRGEGLTKRLEKLTPAEFRELYPRLQYRDTRTQDPRVAAQTLFGKGTEPRHLRSYELVSDLIGRSMEPSLQRRVFRNYRDIIQNRLHLELPKEGWWQDL